VADAPDYEGIVVLGVSRSGTTLMRRLLDAHPLVAAPGETCALSAAARFLHAQPMGSGAAFGALSGLTLAGFPEEEVVRRVRELGFGFLREHAAAHGKRIWADKTAVNVFHLPRIERICGEHVRYVVMVRNGLDVVCSLQDLVARTGGWFEELHAYVCRDPRPLVAMAHAWSEGTSAALELAARRPDRVHVLRYEDLVSEPGRELASLAAFLRLEVPPAWVETALASPGTPGFGDWKTWETVALHRDSVGRHAILDRAIRSAVLEVLGPTLERAGYPRPPADLDAEAASRRAELAMRLSALKKKPTV
jgi:protein-tyrosine sulfotransferase